MKPSQPSFDFKNSISPTYIEPLFLRIEMERWYATSDLVTILQSGGLDVEGSNIVQYNTAAWSLAGLGEVRTEQRGRSQTRLFRLNSLGRQVQDTYSTNTALFYDLMHFLFYSAWHRSRQIQRARFWLYASVSDALWAEAPHATDNLGLTNTLQADSARLFPSYQPAFSERSVRAAFTWLAALTPPFLAKCGTGSQLCSSRRSYCSPQIFHLATNLLYATEGLAYGTSMALDERHIEAISRVCLLDAERFWEMADLTKSAINGFQIRRGQWGVSIALDAPPDWIVLPDFSQESAATEENLLEVEGRE
jgi:hypothetical protein